MKRRTMTMEVDSTSSAILGDVMRINDERWVVIETRHDGKSLEVVLEPLTDCLAKTTYCTQIPESFSSFTIAEYIEKLCDEYESNHTC